VFILLIWANYQTALHATLISGIICSVWFFQFRWLWICKPRYFAL